MSDKKKSKFYKNVLLFNKKLTSLTIQIEFLFKNKYITQENYIEKMYLLNEVHTKINNIEIINDKIKNYKNLINDLIEDINKSLEKICNKLGSNTIKNTLEIYEIDINNELIDMYNDYFIPLSSNIIVDTENFLNKMGITDINVPIIVKTFENTKSNTLIEKINGATFIFYINNKKIIYINGYFNKDSLNICKTVSKLKLIKEEVEYLDVPSEFKEKYLEQLSLRDFIILKPTEIANIMKSDYNDFLNYKNKPLSLLIKEFIKSNIEKQRKILILFLISDQDSQFTAHIIFDLITEKSFLSESQYLSDVIYNSLHWKIQQIFKISNGKFESSKKKLENITLNDIPYESRILSLKTTDTIKSKAMEKLKEINGSKENSIKAQQWLDGFLKIPFNTLKQEPIIDFFKTFQAKIIKYIDIFTIKIAEFDINNLDENNKTIYNIIIQIIDEFHGNTYKSENSYDIFIKYVENIKLNICQYIDCKYCFDETPTVSPKSHKSQKNHVKIFIDELDNDNDNDNDDNDNDIKSLYDTDDNENAFFKKYISKHIEELRLIIKEWKKFKSDKKKYMKDVDKILDKCTYGQSDAKNQMKRIIGQWMNGTSKGQCFGLCGPPGVGKTTLCKNGLAKCLFDENGEERPFAFLPLGGATNGSIMEGHHYTYLGSTWGKIVDILMEKKCMNPIIYIDELDKISKTEHGKEIISILTHITDQSQNKEFYDRYFASIPIDLSNVLFIFSYNDRDNIDRVLRDRIQEITIKPLSTQEKLIISQNYITPEILNNVGFSESEIVFTNDMMTKIINEYTHEAGVRKLSEILYDIIRDINLRKIIDDEDISYPIIIDDKYSNNILSNMPKMNVKKIDGIDRVGMINGLYATESSLGGITKFQILKTISDKKFSLEKLTGSLGEDMKESIYCAMTIAWNIIPDDIKKNIEKNKEEGYGLHVHCGDTSTQKSGPSGGIALTLGIISRLTNIKIRNNIAITGEINLLGDTMNIGGLYSKLQGALEAGIKTVLIPKDNEKDLDLIFKKEESEKNNIKKSQSIKKMDSFLLLENSSYNTDLINKRVFRNTIDIYLIDNIYDALQYALVENNLVFNKIF